MKIYKLIYTLLVIPGILLQSCIDDFLTQYPYSTSVAETFYETGEHFQQALAGAYNVINATSVNGTGCSMGTYYYGLYYILEGCSDVAIAGTGTGSYFDTMRGTYQTNQAEIRQFWVAFFVGVSRCNYIITEADNGRNNLTQAQKQQYVGEARFLRAFYYTHLAQMFGGVPLYDAPSSGDLSPRDNLEAIYTQIIDDLKFAYTNLGDEGTNKSGANKWTAGAYLGTVYNYLASCKRFNVGKDFVDKCPLNSFEWVNETQMSQNARTVLEDVVKNSPYELVGSSDYKKLFYEYSKSVQYRECLLMAEYADNTKHCGSTYYQMCPAGDAKLYGGSYHRIYPGMGLYQYYTDADARRDRFITAWINPNGKYNKVPTGVPFETVDNHKYYLPEPSSGDKSGQSYTLWCPGKFRVSDPTSRTNIAAAQCVLNFPLIRMADVYLHYAEALYFCNEEVAARKALEPLRERILTEDETLQTLTDAYYRTDFVEELLDERARELCFEAKRKVDLIRFGKITERIMGQPVSGTNNLKNGIQTLQKNWEEYKIWLPIPQLEMDLNRNLVQNPHYAD